MPLTAAVIVIEVLILAGLLSKGWTGVVVFGALIVTNGSRMRRYGKTLRAKLLSR